MLCSVSLLKRVYAKNNGDTRSIWCFDQLFVFWIKTFVDVNIFLNIEISLLINS